MGSAALECFKQHILYGFIQIKTPMNKHRIRLIYVTKANAQKKGQSLLTDGRMDARTYISKL